MTAQHYFSQTAASEKIEEVDEEEQLMWRSEHSHIVSEDEEGSEDELLIEDASSMSSSPSIPDENINFDLVYALHTFVATVEGQASVVKGDALILMEDTNIYWWLVEVLKTREVGYIPAENIETPYERLARLNKHRNVEITSPSIHDNVPIPIQHPLHPPRRVTIGDESMSKIFHYEVESDFDENEDYEETQFEDEDEDEETEPVKGVDNEFQEMIMDSYNEQDNRQEWQEKHWDEESPLEEVVEQLREQEKHLQEPYEEDQHHLEDDLQTMELRVFAGNIGQGPLFHTLSITASTTADELIMSSVNKFGMLDAQSSEDTTIEYYIAVQGMDGDEYILSAQDKPFSIFKTLTDSLTTPMPSLKHIRRISQQSLSSIQSRSSRPRSSSFSNFEQTSYDEDYVIRFYLHRRIKRAHEREDLLYIKVSLFPDETAMVANPSATTTPKLTDAFTKNPTPTKSLKKRQPRISTRSEIDRIDKIIAVRQKSPIGAVINLALEKFHVPDAHADDYPDKMEHLRDSRQLGKYRMSVRGNGQEIELDPNELMSNVLLQQQSSSPNHSGPITSDLLFVLRKSEPNTKQTQKQRHSSKHRHQSQGDFAKRLVTSPQLSGSEDRRPSILDILMDSTPRLGDRRPSAMGNLLEPSGRLVDENRRPSGSNNYQPERKSSLTQQHSQQQSPSSSSSFPISKSPNSILGFNRRSSNQSSSVISNSSLDDRVNSDSNILLENNSNIDITPTSSTSTMRQQPSSTSPGEKKKESFKQQFKRLVGWGSSSATTTSPKKQTSIQHSIPPPLTTHTFSSNKLDLSHSPSDISFISAPSTPLPPTPGTNRSLALPKSRQGSLSHPLETGSRRPSEDPSAAALAVAAVISASSRRLSTVSSISSQSSTSSVTPEEIAAATSQNLETMDEDEDDDDDDTGGLIPEDKREDESKEIQAQYAMWITSQPAEAPAKNPIKTLPPPVKNPLRTKSSTLSVNHSISSLSLLTPSQSNPISSSISSSSMNQKTEITIDDPTESLHPIPAQDEQEIDDLFLLVAHGVDFLTSRENTKWEEESGYRFHPWNRPQSSFATKQEVPEVPEIEPPQPEPSSSDSVHDDAALAMSLLSSPEEEHKLISPPLTPLPQPQHETPKVQEAPSAMAKRILGAKHEAHISKQPPPLPQQQQHQAVDDEELQRIVAAHILF